jgi:type VI secretion system FHA domain protein
MPLKLTIIRQPETDADAGLPAIESKVFDESGGVLGRDPENDWVLPHRYVSRHHARIHFESGRFYVRDTSQNGVYVNDQLVGQGNSAVLTDGDRIVIGDYEILVQTALVAAPSIGVPEPPRALFGSDDGLGLGDVLPPAAAPHVPGIAPGMVDLLAPEPTPPPAWDAGRRGVPTEGDVLPAVSQPYRAPEALPEIPANWWQEDLPGAAPATPAPRPSPPLPGEGVRAEPPRPPEPARSVETAPPPPAPPAPVAAAGAKPGGGGLDALAAGLGLAPALPPGASEEEVLQLAGALLRELVRGTMELLRARASIKQEARLEMTTLRPVENNPLKFSVTPDEALQRLLSPEASTGYLAPREAVVEAMQDLRAHELATLAGLEAAIRGMFARFDPQRLEQDFSDRSLLASILPAHRKARCWDLFAQQFRQIGEEAREDFNALFGREFARAYEEQVRRLRSAGPR